MRARFLTPPVFEGLAHVAEKMVAWTVNDAARAQELLDMGVSGVVTDSPEVLALVAGSADA